MRGLWDCTIPRHRKIVLEQADYRHVMRIVLSLNQNIIGVKFMLGEIVLCEEPLYIDQKPAPFVSDFSHS